jgi:undecaprenyl-diphosphatase
MRRAEPRLGETVALGLIHGPAELLPVSSSAHVELLPWALGWQHARLPGAARKEVEVALHAGTALVLALAMTRPRLGLLATATGPAALAGLLLEKPIEARLGTPLSVAGGLVVGAIAMVAADRSIEPSRFLEEAEPIDGAWLGAAQALALVPGVSRSGAARAIARARGFDRAEAAALSREVALPVLAGAAVLKGVRLARRKPGRATLRALAAGAGASALSTAVALRFDRGDTPLAVFAGYRVALAGAIVVRVWHDRAR